MCFSLTLVSFLLAFSLLYFHYYVFKTFYKYWSFFVCWNSGHETCTYFLEISETYFPVLYLAVPLFKKEYVGIYSSLTHGGLLCVHKAPEMVSKILWDMNICILGKEVHSINNIFLKTVSDPKMFRNLLEYINHSLLVFPLFFFLINNTVYQQLKSC